MESQETTDKAPQKKKEKCKKLCELTDKDIEEHLEKRLRFTGNGKDIYSRYSAYDYCYNCFRDIHEDFLKRQERKLDSDEMEKLCLQLGLFLGTWGMFRNSDLQTSSFRIYEPLIKKIFEEEVLWDIDVKDYCVKKDEINSETLKAICCFKNKVHVSLGQKDILVTDTLATKIMMVVFGCVPAYDRNFSATLDPQAFGENSLKYIYNFYHKNKGLLDQKQMELKTVDVDGGLTNNTYTIAKIIDIIGFHVTEKIMNESMDPKEIVKREKREKRKQNKEQNLKRELEELKKGLKDC